MPKIIGIIPARYKSTRFPGKPFAQISGKTLIQRSYENARQCKTLEQLIVATDDQRIYDHVQSFGGTAIMTSEDCPTGTDRLSEVICNTPSLEAVEIIVNIQGDEPCINPRFIDLIAITLKDHPEAAVSTLITPLLDEKEALNPSIVKCVIDRNHYALYFSRTLIPSGKDLKFKPDQIYYKHLGIFGYRREFLLHYAHLPLTPLQLAEDLEQLKVLEHGYKIITSTVHGECADVNTPEDIQKIEQLLCKQNSFL
jgi:3-deoxy-manno-octulosonate cytidylyltransferase (CMP-KDO synthetase)